MPKRDSITIHSPHNVELDYTSAGLGERMLAYILDVVFLMLYLFFINLIYPENVLESVIGYNNTDILRVLLIVIPFFFYDVVFEYLLNGQTLGKKLMKIRVIRLDGEKPQLQHYAIRWVFRIVETGFLALGTIPVLSYLISKRHQRLGDLAADTVVIKIDDNRFFSTSYLYEQKNTDYVPVFADTSWATRNDIDLIYHCLHKFYTKNTTEEGMMIAKMADAIQERYDGNKLEESELSKMSNTQILRAFAKDFNYQEAHDTQAPNLYSRTIGMRSTRNKLRGIKQMQEEG